MILLQAGPVRQFDVPRAGPAPHLLLLRNCRRHRRILRRSRCAATAIEPVEALCAEQDEVNQQRKHEQENKECDERTPRIE
jgi:hypothetical protein